MRHKKKIFFTALIVLSVVAATIYVWAEESQKRRTENAFREMERFAEVFQKVLDGYVDERDSEELIDAAINGMLEELDPHSVYLSRHQFENLMIDTKGEFGGLGIQIAIRDYFPTVISPIEGTPADRLGIMSGDRIVQIEKASTYRWNSEKTVSKLRGEPGTQVNVTIQREGLADSLYYTITREIIKVPSITYWENLDGIGYIRVSRFGAKTARDLDRMITDFETEGIRGLIIDLRSNPGGLLDAARDVTELFLGRDTLIVYTEGRLPSHNRKFYSLARKIHSGYPLVIMVNGASASASEIVAGALQDWDRAVIVGHPTFGKGSVQTVYKIGGDSALKLTTAKYFTPTGRSIHKDFHKEDEGEAADESAPEQRKEYRTAGERIVYSSGGITPDWEFEIREYTDLERELELRGTFFSFAVHYTAYNEVDETFEVTEHVLAEFKDFLASKEITVEDDQWDEENTDYARIGIKREVFRKLFGTRGAYIATLSEDEEVLSVLEMFSQAPTLAGMFDYIEERNIARAEKK